MNDDRSAESEGVCVVTHPLSDVSETAVNSLLTVIASAAGSASLITANLPETSEIREEFEFREVSTADTGDGIVIAATRFVLNQIRMARELVRRDEEVVLFFGATSYLLPILAARILGKEIVLEPRGNVPESLRRIWAARLPDPIAYALSRPVWLLERVGYVVADAILVLSPAMADDLGLRSPRYAQKLSEWGTRPVDIETFRPRTPFSDRPDRIGYLGRLDEEKGVDRLIEVVEHLPEDHTFVFIGDGALRPRIEDELSDRLQDGSVSITGWIDHDEVPEHLDGLKLLVMTARTEGVPTTAIEAMACGTPVCASPVGGIPDVVRDGDTGYILEDADPERQAARIEEILREEDLEERSERCRAFATEMFSFDVVVQRYRDVFDDL